MSGMRRWLSGFVLMLSVVQGAVAFGQDAASLHPGESITPAGQASADAPMRRRQDDPWIELSNPRSGRLGGLVVDYKFVTGGPGMFSIVIKDGGGRSVYSVPWATGKQGSVECNKFGFAGFGPNVEIWAESESFPTAFNSKAGRKLSRSITMGTVGQLTMPREWTADEAKQAEAAKLAAAPPPPPPTGYQVTNDRMNLLPGMPVLGTLNGQWEEAELISVAPRQVSIRLTNKGGRIPVLPQPYERVAVSQATLDQGKANPSAFTPSIRTLPGGMIAIPDDLTPLTRDVKLGKGVPLYAEWGQKWEKVYATGNWEGDQVPIVWENWKNWYENLPQARLLISKADLETLKTPEGLANFKSKMPESIESAAPRSPFGAKDYPISMRIPNGYVKLPEDLLVPEETMLGAQWGGRWYDLKVLADSDEGPVYVKWDRLGGDWREEINRPSLVIKSTSLKKLQAAQKQAAAAANAPATKEMPASKPSSSPPPAGGSYELVLESVGTKKIPVAKEVMAIAGLSLKDALDLADALPIAIKSGITKEEAEQLKSKITAAGGTATVKAGN